MNSFKGKLTQDDVNEVIAYLKYLNNPADVAGGDSETGLRGEDGGAAGTEEAATDAEATEVEAVEGETEHSEIEIDM